MQAPPGYVDLPGPVAPGTQSHCTCQSPQSCIAEMAEGLRGGSLCFGSCHMELKSHFCHHHPHLFEPQFPLV